MSRRYRLDFVRGWAWGGYTFDVVTGGHVHYEYDRKTGVLWGPIECGWPAQHSGNGFRESLAQSAKYG